MGGSVVGLVVDLEARGFKMEVTPAGTLRIAPSGQLTPDLRAEVARHKPALLTVLWRLQAMREIGVDMSGAGLRPPVAVARRPACGGPGLCLSCGDALPRPTDYGRCEPCDLAADVYYITRTSTGEGAFLV